MKCNILTKMIVVMLCFSFILSAPVNIFAVEYQVDESVSVITQEAFQDLFAGKERSIDNLSVDSVRYVYDFYISKESNLADVWMNVIFTISGIDYAVELTGTVTGQLLTTGELFWEGPIEGIIEINETRYLVIASFAKIGTEYKDVQICATIQTLDSKNTIIPVVILFGDEVITQEIHSQVYNQKFKNIGSGNEITNSSLYENRSLNYLEIGEDSTTFAYNGKESQYLQVVNSGVNRVTAWVFASPDNINEYYRTLSSGAVTGVSSVTITLSVGTNTSNSTGYIVGVENYDFGNNYGKANAALEGLFYDILSFLGVPTSTLDVILEDLTGTVQKSSYTNETSVTISSVSDSSIYEEYGLPITFQLDTSLFESVYVGPTNYIMTSSIKYLSMYLPMFSDVYTYSYTNTPEAVVDIPYTLGGV